ncbi:unnamed protein product [Hymenolepis diminuta]|uniref:Uncharacterized protein n=1 Tax=Hymenolepis diminuta TaxID=6216 RepID=A0A564YW74_HYMDI|nr:unnamed protein product [Hymenolepis diminuta]
MSYKKLPPLCWLCGKMRYCRDCPFRNHICNVCKKEGYICRKNSKGYLKKNNIGENSIRSFNFFSVVSSISEERSPKRWQNANLAINE